MWENGRAVKTCLVATMLAGGLAIVGAAPVLAQTSADDVALNLGVN